METRKLPTLQASIGLALLLNAGSALASPPPAPPAQEAVVLTGWLHVEDLTMADVVLKVEVNGTTELATVSESGRFTVTLPAETEAVLRFEKPGHLPKEVVVDTHHAQDGEPGQHTRRVKFAVIMQLVRHMGGQRYAGPVGSLAFDDGGGCLAVSHDQKLVPVQRQALMVF